MKKLFLHLGFHKTATSSFQRTCMNNREVIERKGYHFPYFSCKFKSEIDNHSIPLFSLFSDNPELYHINIKWSVKSAVDLNVTYKNQLDKILSENDNVILSGEDVSILNVKNLSALKLFIESYGFEIVPLCLVRSPYSFHCSVTQEIIKGGQYVPIDGFRSQLFKINNIIEVFGKSIRFIPFSRACKHPLGPVGYLFENIGIDSACLKIHNINDGLSNTAVRLQNIANEKQPRIVAEEINPAWKNLSYIGYATKQEKFLLTEEEFGLIYDKFEKENSSMLSTLGEDYLDVEIKFSKILDVVHDFSNILLQSKEDYADVLRDAAIRIESYNVREALKLMELAKFFRPNGGLINEKVTQYKNVIYKGFLGV